MLMSVAAELRIGTVAVLASVGTMHGGIYSGGGCWCHPQLYVAGKEEGLPECVYLQVSASTLICMIHRVSDSIWWQPAAAVSCGSSSAVAIALASGLAGDAWMGVPASAG
jgi:hypothetical protein